MKRTLLFTTISSLILTSSCQNNTGEKAESNKNSDFQKDKTTIYLADEVDENKMIGTFKFDLSHEKTEVFYYITFDYEFKKAIVKIIDTHYFRDNNYSEDYDEERDGVKMSSEKFENVVTGKIKTLSNTDKLLKCRLELSEDDTYDMYFDKVTNKWYIDVKSTIYSDFMSKEKAYGIKQN